VHDTVNNPLRFEFTGCEHAGRISFCGLDLFARGKTLLAVSVEPSQAGSYVAPPDYRVMDLKDYAF
jgi:hypothetical protein